MIERDIIDVGRERGREKEIELEIKRENEGQSQRQSGGERDRVRGGETDEGRDQRSKFQPLLYVVILLPLNVAGCLSEGSNEDFLLSFQSLLFQVYFNYIILHPVSYHHKVEQLNKISFTESYNNFFDHILSVMVYFRLLSSM